MKYIIPAFFIIAAIMLHNALETPVVYKDINNNMCECWVDGYSTPSKDQCQFVGKNYEVVRIQKCDN